MEQLIPIIVSTAITAFAAFLSWYHADTQSKARAIINEEKVSALERKHDKDEEAMDKRVTELERSTVQITSENHSITKEIERLDLTKASKDVVDNFKNEIITLKTDMDKRFDRIERLLERVTSPRTKGRPDDNQS